MRGIAVLAIFCFHAGLLGGAGLTAVDSFMTVSGYLIGRLLVSEVATLRGAVRFLGRRVRRILPPLTIVVTTVYLGTRWLYPLRTGTTAAEARAVLLLWYNWYAKGVGAGYEGASRLTGSAFAHMWSLSVEEQFYLVAPFAALAMVRLLHGRARSAVLLTGLTALAVSLGFLFGSVSALDYYDTRSRLAALGLGLVVAALPTGAAVSAGRLTRRLGVLPLVLFLGSLSVTLTMVGTELLFVLPASLSTGILLLAIVHTSPDPFTARFLQLPVLRYFGVRCYEIFLWHMPVLYVWRRSWDSDGRLLPLLAVITLLLGEATYRWVSRPLRSGRPGRRLALTSTAALLAAAVVVTATTLWSVPADVPNSSADPATCLPATNAPCAALEPADGGYLWDCPGEVSFNNDELAGQDPRLSICELHRPDVPLLTVALVGSSMTKSLAPGLLEAAVNGKWLLVAATRIGCHWTASSDDFRGRESLGSVTAELTSDDAEEVRACDVYTRELQEVALAEYRPDVIVVTGPLTGVVLPEMRASAASRSMVEQALERLTSRGSEVLVVEYPRWRTARRVELAGPEQLPLGRAVTVPRGDRVSLFDLTPALCTGDCAEMIVGGHPLFSDQVHLSVHGSRLLGPALARSVESLAYRSRSGR